MNKNCCACGFPATRKRMEQEIGASQLRPRCSPDLKPPWRYGSPKLTIQPEEGTATLNFCPTRFQPFKPFDYMTVKLTEGAPALEITQWLRAFKKFSVSGVRVLCLPQSFRGRYIISTNRLQFPPPSKMRGDKNQFQLPCLPMVATQTVQHRFGQTAR